MKNQLNRLSRNLYINLIAMIVVSQIGVIAVAQHDDEHEDEDLQFSYQEGVIVVEGEHPLVHGEFPTSGIGQQFTTAPGFLSEVDLGFGIGALDEIAYDVLGPLRFWDGIDVGAAGSEVAIRISHSMPSVYCQQTLPKRQVT